MIIVLKNNSQEKQVEELLNWLDQFHVSTNLVEGVHSNVIGLIGDTTQIDIEAVQAKECVENVQRVQEPYKNANRKFHPDNTVIDVAGRKIGGGKLQVIAGPCSVENEDQIIETAEADNHNCYRCKGSRCNNAQRWRIQAKNFTIFIPGSWQRGHRSSYSG